MSSSWIFVAAALMSATFAASYANSGDMLHIGIAVYCGLLAIAAAAHGGRR